MSDLYGSTVLFRLLYNKTFHCSAQEKVDLTIDPSHCPPDTWWIIMELKDVGNSMNIMLLNVVLLPES